MACPRCAEPHAGTTPVTCAQCVRRPPPYDSLTAPYRYGGELAIAIQRLKYSHRPDIARALAPLLAPALVSAAAGANWVMPIPLARWRHARRGFNQAWLLPRKPPRAPTCPATS